MFQTCCHCSTHGKQEILSKVSRKIRIGYAKEIGEITLDVEYYLVLCKSCDSISLFGYLSDEDSLQLIYPRQLNSSFVPKKIIAAHKEATKVKHASSTAYAVMARRALEILCKDQSAKGKDLFKQIEDLAKRDLIPSNIAKIAHNIRLLGNDAAHAITKPIRPYEADAIYELLDAIIEYLYILPKKIKNLEQLTKKRRSS